MKFLWKLFLLLIITIVGAGITGFVEFIIMNTSFWSHGDWLFNFSLSFWIVEIIISFFIGVYYAFLREEDTPEDNHTSKKDQDIETKDTELERMSNF